MSIFKGSRYDGAENTLVETRQGVDGQGRTSIVRRDFIHNRRVFTLADLRGEARSVPLLPTDALDGLALKHGGEDQHWWKIADINNLGGEDVADLFEPALDHMTLLIPTTEGFSRI
jgi:hypothetical protein